MTTPSPEDITISFGLAEPTINGAYGSQITNWDTPLLTFGISDSRKMLFTERSLADFATGSVYYTQSPIGIVKLAQPAMLVISVVGGNLSANTLIKCFVPYIVDQASVNAIDINSVSLPNTSVAVNVNNITKLHWENDQQTSYTLSSGGATGPTVYYYNTSPFDSPENITVTLDPDSGPYKNWKFIIQDHLRVNVGVTWSVVHNGDKLVEYRTGNIAPQELEFIWSDTHNSYSITKKNLEQPFSDKLVGSSSFGHDFYSHKRMLRASYKYNPIDVVFVIDYTGSMGTPIELVKDGIEDIVDYIREASNDNYRLGLVIYDESGAPTPAYNSSPTYSSLPAGLRYVGQSDFLGVAGGSTYQYITCMATMSFNNFNFFSQQLSYIGPTANGGFRLGSGGAGPEPGDLAIDMVCNLTGNFATVGLESNGYIAGSFRNNANKIIIHITDNIPSYDCDQWADEVKDNINNVIIPGLIGQEIKVVYAYTTSIEPINTGTGSYDSMALQTGGVSVNSDIGGTWQSLNSGVRSALEQLTPRQGVSAIFPEGSIIFLEEAFLTVNQKIDIPEGITGTFSIGLSEATNNGLTGSLIPTNPNITNYGLDDSSDIIISLVKLTKAAMPIISSAWVFDQDGDITVHIPYMVDNPPFDSVQYPYGPTATIYARPEILGYSPQFSGTNNNLPALPVPKIHLNKGSQLIDVFSYSTNGIHDTQAILHSYPTLINLDFTSDHFANPNNRIFIEMAMFKRKSNKKKGIIITRSASKWVVPSKHIAGVGQDTNLPWLSTGNFWSRGGSHSVYNFATNTTQILGIDRPNHYEVYGYTVSNYPIWQYFTGRFEYADVLYRDSSMFDPNNPTTSLSTINTLIPISGKRGSGKFKLTTRYSYSSMYTPVYCAFRYIQYFPNANGGKGQILSGPFSKTLKITGLYHPFNSDYLTSAQVGYPVANISGDWLGIGFRSLKCYWESNLP